MKKVIALLLVLVLAFAVAACQPAAAPAAEAEEPALLPPTATPLPRKDLAPIAADAIKVGVILVHDENSGYDMAHIDGVTGACKALGIPDANLIMKTNIPEDETCYDTAVDLAEQGCNIIFSDSYSHQSYMMQAAAEYPDIIFVACTGDTAARERITNAVNIFPHTYQSRYLSGVVAGMKLKELMDAGTVTDPYVGYVGAYPYAEVVSGYTAFFLGVRTVVEGAHMDVQYTNSWYDPTAEAEAANALISKGCVIIGQHADSTGAPSAVQAAKDGGKVVYSVGYNIDMLAAAPTAALTSAQNNWVALYTPILQVAINGGQMPADLAATIANDGVMISQLGPECAAGTQEAVDAVTADLKSGARHVFDVSTFTVGDKAISSYNTVYGYEGVEMIADGYFHESEFRSAPCFDIRIDGITELN
ncbi:MAG: BMP family ABC transporter substrate-binding protein [Eubacteriales bacterium]|nr:BMP family ABC transporter substrate-binding protein [Eubacteriales bacterium]